MDQDYYRKKQVAQLLGISESTVVRWVARNILPQPFQMGPNRVVWDKGELEAAIIKLKHDHRGFRSPYGSA